MTIIDRSAELKTTIPDRKAFNNNNMNFVRAIGPAVNQRSTAIYVCDPYPYSIMYNIIFVFVYIILYYTAHENKNAFKVLISTNSAII